MRAWTGVMLLAACGGVVDEPGPMEPETPAEPLPFSVVLTNGSPIVTADPEVELRFNSNRPRRELGVGDGGGPLAGDEWTGKPPTPAGAGSAAARSHVSPPKGSIRTDARRRRPRSW